MPDDRGVAFAKACTFDTCWGVPPSDCLALGPERFVANALGTECLKCEDNAEQTIIFTSVIVLVFLFVVLPVLTWLAHKDTGFTRRVSAIFTVFFNHAQTIALIGKIDFDWPLDLQA